MFGYDIYKYLLPTSLNILGFEREYGLLSQFKANHVAILTAGHCICLLLKPLIVTGKSGRYIYFKNSPLHWIGDCNVLHPV